MKKINKVSREPPTTIQDAIKRYILQLYTLQREPNHTGEIIPFNMDKQKRPLPYKDNQQAERAIICPISHYKETSSTTYHQGNKKSTHGK